MKFKAFVILGTMRTGSNFLEATLSEIPGLDCHGELFNPAFIGKLKQHELLGYDLARRDDDPEGLLDAVIAASDGLPGFRLFDGHDPRILTKVLADPDIAKIILTRDMAECYLSLRHAQESGQWRSGDYSRTRTAKVTIDRAAYAAWRERIAAHYAMIAHAVRATGQTAFQIDYAELYDLELLNGIAQFLGIQGRTESVSGKIKKQIAVPPSELITNWADVSDLFTDDAPEQRFRSSGPGVNRYLAAEGAPLLFMPVRGGTDRDLAGWFARLGPLRELNQNKLRKWREDDPAIRSFTVVRHPVDRMVALYFSDIRSDLKAKLDRRYEVKFIEHPDDEMLVQFARIVRASAAGQTSISPPPDWAPQSDSLNGLGQLAAPDHVLRDETLPAELAALCSALKLDCGDLPPAPDFSSYRSEALEAEVRAVWGRDFLNFGYAASVR